MARSIVNAFLVAEAETGLTDCNKPDAIRAIQTAKSRNKAAANHKYVITSIPERGLNGNAFFRFLHVGLDPTSALISSVVRMKQLIYLLDLYSGSRLFGSPLEFAKRHGRN